MIILAHHFANASINAFVRLANAGTTNSQAPQIAPSDASHQALWRLLIESISDSRSFSACSNSGNFIPSLQLAYRYSAGPISVGLKFPIPLMSR